ncbi:MAG: helix-turn-helix domain-containing protein [Endozoicomonas sp.]
MSTLGDRLKVARTERGLSQSELARAVGSRQSSINDIESGRISKSTYILPISRVLNVDPNWLETGVGSLRGTGVTILNQGAPLPLYHWDTIVEIALDNNFEKSVIDMLYRCPVKHSERAFTTVLEHARGELKKGAVLFLDPVTKFTNGDYVLVVFPESRMMDLRLLVSDGVNAYLKSLDPEMPAERAMSEFRFTCLGGGELAVPQTKNQEMPEAILAGRVIFFGHRLQ